MDVYQNATVILTIITVILTFLLLILGWKHYKVAREERSSTNEMAPGRIVRIYSKHDLVAAEQVAITERANEGDLLFGACRTCGNYPTDLCPAIARAVGRGAKVEVVILDHFGAEDFASFLAGLDPTKVKIRKSKSEFLRVYGIKDKEVMLAIPLTDSYTGIHFLEEHLVDVWYQVFQSIPDHNGQLKS